jgi:hypothetical protein
MHALLDVIYPSRWLLELSALARARSAGLRHLGSSTCSANFPLSLIDVTDAFCAKYGDVASPDLEPKQSAVAEATSVAG